MSDISKEKNQPDGIPDVLKKILFIVVIIGIIVSLPLIYNAIKGEYYSSLYLLPDNYTNYPKGSSTSFVYGVKCYEKEVTNYYLDIYLGEHFSERKELRLFPGNCIENEVSLDLNGVTFPSKVNIILTSPYDSYQVGYWLKNSG